MWFPLVSEDVKESAEKFRLKVVRTILHVNQQSLAQCVLGELWEYPYAAIPSIKVIGNWL